MNTTLSSHVTPLRFSVIRSMLERASAYHDVISLSIGEPDFDTPDFVCEAAMKDAKRGFTHYAASRGDPDLRAALLAAERAKSGLPWEQEHLLITSGAMHGLLAVMRTLLDEGDEVLCPAPCFSDYQGHCALAGGKLVQVATRFEDGFLPTREAMEAALTPKTRALLVNSPCNPSGVVFDAATLDMLADFAVSHDLVVISDEVYDSIVFKGQAESIATRPGMFERTVVLNSFSKAFAMTGWRVGYALGPAWIMNEMIKVLSYSVASTGTPNQRAALAALNGPREEFDAFRDAYRRRTKLAAERLNAMPGVRCLEPAGTFYLFPHIDAAEDDSLAFALDLLDKEQVIVVPGFPFGPEETVKGCVRLACTVNEEKLVEAMDRLERYLKEKKS
ncbi:pyridoxal phosphate-dependent aminotransferase [Mailhella sp.]|uniref:pyridoxal phosphate-dependent aminotransferase n=1 Tax=Mailhella sp. TaxID=1981029 RepID=UPI003AB39EAB